MICKRRISDLSLIFIITILSMTIIGNCQAIEGIDMEVLPEVIPTPPLVPPQGPRPTTLQQEEPTSSIIPSSTTANDQQYNRSPDPSSGFLGPCTGNQCCCTSKVQDRSQCWNEISTPCPGQIGRRLEDKRFERRVRKSD